MFMKKDNPYSDSEECLLASILDPRKKHLQFLTPSERTRAHQLLKAKYVALLPPLGSKAPVLAVPGLFARK